MNTSTIEVSASDSGIRIVPSKRESEKALFLPPDSSELIFAKKARTPTQPPKRIKFGMLRDRRLRMLAAITVELERKTETFVAHWPEIDEFGYGDNASEALEDFRKTIEELYLT
ncbi:MAG TPA: hypothetical protein VK210_07460, partial [Terriglobia bacterium]|nr:hypothetical protein [Terriglobia bacterium]